MVVVNTVATPWPAAPTDCYVVNTSARRNWSYRTVDGASCLTLRQLPALPPKTLPLLQDATAPAVVSRRWAELQRYLDAALERVADPDCPCAALDAFKEFLCLDA